MHSVVSCPLSLMRCRRPGALCIRLLDDPIEDRRYIEDRAVQMQEMKMMHAGHMMGLE